MSGQSKVNHPVTISLAGRILLAGFCVLFGTAAQAAISCTSTITANVVVLDNPTVFNRLGAQNPNWITYALKRDVVFQDRNAPGVPGVDPGANALNGTPCSMTQCTAGNVELRPDKRTRPLVVRSIEGACLTVNFTNWLTGPGQAAGNTDPVTGEILGDPGGANPNNAQQDELINNDQVKGRCAGFHATGTELFHIDDDGSMVGNNYPGGDVTNNCSDGSAKGSLVGPGGTITYNLYTPHEGAFTINSYGATLGSEASSGNAAVGMFGALNVQPIGSRIYRSQVTEEEMRLATTGYVEGDCAFEQVEIEPGVFVDGDPIGTHGITCNPGGQPIIDYEARYPQDCENGLNDPIPGDGLDGVWCTEGKAGLPILNMLDGGVLVHSDINAIIAGPNADGSFPNDTYPLTSDGKNNPPLPNRLEPFREFTSIFHDEQTNSQVFPLWYKDQFMINSGSGGIGSEIIANRLHTGPMHDCTDCAYEEFFLSSSTVGDPALLVNFPANTGIEQCDPKAIAGPSCWRDPTNLANGPVALPDPVTGEMVPVDNFALFQEDPSNVHHAYTGDFTKIRNTHAGSFEQHIFHLHNHQWLFNPNDDNANYLDAQEIMPGSGHTYELVNGGVGNRNRTAGDAIFHCHFYPHFAQGMWYHIRIMDVFEKGTVLAVSGADDPQNPTTGFHANAFDLRSGKPMAGARALPDGELPDGVPIPAIVPLPGQAMPQMPAKVQVAAVDRGDHGLLAGREPPEADCTTPDLVTGICGVLNQGPDSSQAFVDRISVAGADGDLGTADDVSPGYPFWLAGNECGPGGDAATGVCPNGIIGQRMPTPPLDMLTDTDVVGADGLVDGTPYLAAQAGGWDGGLPRHSLLGYVSGGLSADTQSRLDFRKVVELAQPVYFPEIGTDLENVSMQYHAAIVRPSAANHLADNSTTAVNFIQNGAPPVPAGPFQDPCVDDKRLRLGVDNGAGQWFDGDGNPTTFNTLGTSEFNSINPRTYKLANIQIDAVFNKVGHHYPQERIIALWEDVEPTIAKQRPPEPLVMRFNTFDCGKILHTNLVPHEFELDDFQVRTPTDIIGQHIHLPKWDLTTGDGAANGWNYEDGALAPGIVRERIHAINEYNRLVQLCIDNPTTACLLAPLTLPGQLGPIDLTGLAPVLTIDTGDPGGTLEGKGSLADPLVAQPHPFFGGGVGDEYLGARTVIQRILIDPVVNIGGVDRGLGLTFTHDHYGPSTFQQIGLYATILAEPAGSTWVHNESGETLYGRPITMADGSEGSTDGGPTSWQAAIVTPDSAPGGSNVGAENIPDHREFYFEMSDFQHAYEKDVYVGADENGRPLLTDINSGNLADGSIFDVTFADAPALLETWKQTVNPPLKLKENGSILDVVAANGACPGPAGNADPNIPRPCAEAINISHSSMWVANYRNEPVGLRVFDPNAKGPDGQNGTQAAGRAGDLAFAFDSRSDRAIPELNTRFGDTPYPPAPYCDGGGGDGINCDRNQGDPFTPIMRAYERDNVKIKMQVGATEEQHQATVHGLKWLSNGSAFGRSPNSGWRNFQSHGISEQFSLQLPLNPDQGQAGNQVNYLYLSDATRDGIWSGTWGILRSYGNPRGDLFELPDNPQRGPVNIVNGNEFAGVCPVERRRGNRGGGPLNLREYDVTAVLANEVLPNNAIIGGVTISANTQIVDPVTGAVLGGDSDGNGIADNVGGPLDTTGGTLVYNRRGTAITACDGGFDEAGNCLGATRAVAGPLNDPTAMMYVRTEDLVFEPRTSAPRDAARSSATRSGCSPVCRWSPWCCAPTRATASRPPCATPCRSRRST
jgi:hypothetical protein